MQSVLILIGALLLFFLIILLSLGAVFFRIACSRRGRLVEKIISNGRLDILEAYKDRLEKGESMLKAREQTEVSIKSDDGLKLYGYFVKGNAPQRTIICVHGYHGSPVHDFSIGIDALLDCGNILFIDQRSHGKSEGRYITFGVRESGDLRAWAQWLSRQLGEAHPIYLDGVSMGATTVLMASALELPKSVKGIIADCSFTSPYDIIACISKKMFKREAKLLIASVDLYCRVFAGFSLNQNSTVKAMEKNKLPVLFAHGTGDRLVPHSMSQRAFDACTAFKNIVLVDNADHGLSYVTETERYSAAIHDLFNLCEKSA